jgi:hypothetical protein
VDLDVRTPLMGYTPLFSSLTTGTLYGRWPDIGLWPIVLSLADKHGVVDVTPHYLAGVTGLPLIEVIACMDRFCQPDPHSRSKAENGARLVLIDPSRAWGWRVVNHSSYKEKARLLGKAEQERISGRNAERMQDRRRPPKTAEDPLSDSDSDSDSDSEKRKRGEGDARSARAPSAKRIPDDFALTDQRRAIAKTEGVDPDREFSKFADYWRSASGANARKHDWDATWRNWCRKAHDMRPNGRAPPGDGPKLTWKPSADEDEANAGR